MRRQSSLHRTISLTISLRRIVPDCFGLLTRILIHIKIDLSNCKHSYSVLRTLVRCFAIPGHNSAPLIYLTLSYSALIGIQDHPKPRSRTFFSVIVPTLAALTLF